MVLLWRLETAMRAASCDTRERRERGMHDVSDTRGSEHRGKKLFRGETSAPPRKKGKNSVPVTSARVWQARVRARRAHLRVVRVLGRHGRGGLGRELIELAGGDTLVHANRHLLGHQHLRDNMGFEAGK